MSFYNFAVCNGSRCIKDDVKYFPDMTEREFKKLYNLYFRPLCLYALHYVSDASVSEDIVQDKTHSIILIVNDNVRKSAPKSYTISGYVTDVVTGETLISAEIVSDSRSGAVEVPDKLLRTAPSVLGEPDVFKTLQMLPGIQAGTSFFPESMSVEEMLMRTWSFWTECRLRLKALRRNLPRLSLWIPFP